MTEPENQTPEPEISGSPEPRAPAEPIRVQVFKEFVALCFGLLIGFFWYLYGDVNREMDSIESQNVIIGLLIIIGFMFRYLQLMRAPGYSTQQAVEKFIRELIVFLLGLTVGFFWYYYYTTSNDLEVHVIILLLIVIFVIARYLNLWGRRKIRRGQDQAPDDSASS